MADPKIKPERFLSDLHQLRSFGRYKTGVVRPAFSKADMDARHWLRQRMSAADLNCVIDGVGNVIGYSRKNRPTLLMGSHTDTQPEGGWLDGAYGVICALEVCRALQECPQTAEMSVDIASWADEEHTYHGFLGSKSFLGLLESDVIKTTRSARGDALEQALFDAGLNGTYESCRPERYLAYLEPHIEQGPRLDLSRHTLGVVTGISGCRDYDVIFTGEANHAGSTPMELRKDAGMALFEFARYLNQRFRKLAEQYTVWAVGRVEFTPGASCVIPGKAVMRLQFRDPDQANMEKLERALFLLAEHYDQPGSISVRVTRQSLTHPASMASQVVECLAETAEQYFPGQWQSMPSAAMHDASIFAPVIPSGMLFVPSKGGISHNLKEDTDEQDLVRGCQMAAYAAVNIIRKMEGRA